MPNGVAEFRVDPLYISRRKGSAAELVDPVKVVLMYLSIPPRYTKMLAFEGFAGKPFQQLCYYILSGFAVVQPEVGIYPPMRVSNELQLPVQNGIREG